METAARSSTSIIPHAEFAAIRQDMEHSDAQREIIIKKSRGMSFFRSLKIVVELLHVMIHNDGLMFNIPAILAYIRASRCA